MSLATSVTKLGHFWKVLASIFFTKVSQIFGNFLVYFVKQHFDKVKTAMDAFWATFGDIGLLFIRSHCSPPISSSIKWSTNEWMDYLQRDGKFSIN